ncbi:MAG: arginine--tRNA ligase [Candidatus Harrisonbacteria bacterium]|nr:arginine--tRNA ligase [Candidatus Harrisonbacteria bacterium]
MISKIEEIIKKVVGDGVRFLVTASEKPEFGHYSTNVAFSVGGDPQKLANEILRQASAFAKASADKQNLFDKVEAKGKFINFWISKEALIKELDGVLKSKKPHSLLKLWRARKINLEFISANPTGPLTMANGRGGFLGDVLANVLELAGNKVTREYYINDAGNQVKLLGESVLLARRSLGEGGGAIPHYQGGYVKDLAKKIKSKNAEEAGREAASILLKEIQKSTKIVGIEFDIWFSEYEKLRKGGEVKKILDLLEKKGMLEKKEGAVWLKTSDIADEKDRVLVKSDGQPTYFLTDLAYHYDKFVKRESGLAIDIWGADHHGYVARLKSGVKALGIDPEKLKIIITQLVRLIEGGKEVKMSKRAGEFITLDDLVGEVGKDAVRFFFLMHSPDTHMDFDLALAKEKSQKNPVYYVQYAYVRCGSILEKAKIKSIKHQASSIKKLESASELALLRELVKWPDVVRQTAEDYQVHRLTRYASEIARAFHNFYEKERVIDEKGSIDEGKLALVLAARQILEKVFDTLGISKLEKM